MLAAAATRPHLLPKVAEKLGAKQVSDEASARGDRRGRRVDRTAGRCLPRAPAHIDRAAGSAGDAKKMTSVTLDLNGDKISHEVEPRETLGGFPARALPADGNASWLRAWRVWRVHGRRRWKGHALLPAPCGHVQRPQGTDARGHGRRRNHGSAAAAFPYGTCAPVRLLHAGHADDGARSSCSVYRCRTTKRSGSNSAATFAAVRAMQTSSVRSLQPDGSWAAGRAPKRDLPANRRAGEWFARSVEIGRFDLGNPAASFGGRRRSALVGRSSVERQREGSVGRLVEIEPNIRSQKPLGSSCAHFARMRASSSLLDRAIEGKVFFRLNGMQASTTTREFRLSSCAS